ncbi:hypothetical protein PINS_up018085, partial [Pythium insidiosum]
FSLSLSLARSLMFQAPPQGHGYGGAPSGAALPRSAMPTAKIELSLSGKDLKDRDVFSKSDPFAILYLEQNASWVRIGETEAIKNNLKPTVGPSCSCATTSSRCEQRLKVEVYDQGRRLQEASHHDLIGWPEFTLGQLMGAPGQSGSSPAHARQEHSKHQARSACALRKCSSRTTCDTALLGSSLANMDGFFSKRRPREDQSWIVVHKTEVIDNNLNPNWRPFDIPVQQLCNGDYKRPLLLQVMDKDSGGRSELIGGLMAKRGSNYVLHNDALQRKKGKKYTNAGLLIPQDCARLPPAVVCRIPAAWEMNLVLGIDYTASNGPANDPRSLHFINPHGWNQYQHAIQTTGSILEAYDSDKMIPVYGFVACHPMPLLVVALPHPSARSYLLRTIDSADRSDRASLNDPRKQKYFVLLIITDGAIMDMPMTIDAIIVIIGVGEADFSSMSALDGDGRQLRASNGQPAARRHCPVRAVHTLCQYMKVRGISPNPPVQPTYQQFAEPSAPAAPVDAPAGSQPPAAAPLPAAPAQAPQAPAPGQPPQAQAPYPGQPQPHGYPGYPPQGYPGQPQGYPGQAPGYPPQQGYGYPPQAQGFAPPPHGAPQGYGGYPGQAPPPQQSQAPKQANPGYPGYRG